MPSHELLKLHKPGRIRIDTLLVHVAQLAGHVVLLVHVLRRQAARSRSEPSRPRTQWCSSRSRAIIPKQQLLCCTAATGVCR